MTCWSRLPFGGVEEFFSYPRVITGFNYVFRMQNNEEEMENRAARDLQACH